MKICPKCNKDHENRGKFCSRKCGNSRVWTDEDKLKISMGVKKFVENNPIIKKPVFTEIRTCVCGNTFECAIKSNKVYCNFRCNPNTGGYREGSGRAKCGYYKGIYCGSTYELAWVIYQIDHNLGFERFSGYLEYNGKKYFPDFLQNGKIIEIKGYEAKESVEAKTVVANKNGYEVIVLRKEKLNTEFEWVKSHYTYKNMHELYDGFKPKFEYVCSFCKNEFNSEKKRKTDIVYCSRSCSLKGTALLHREENSIKVSKTLTGRKRNGSIV